MLANNLTPISAQSANKKFLLLFFLCCSLPFIAAKLALAFYWLPVGVTNKGQWLEQEIQLLPVAAPTPQHWHLVYVQEQRCSLHCELALYAIQQIKSGLGRQQDQVGALILADKTPEQLAHFSTIQWLPFSANSTELQGHIFIVNQQGLALLRYPVVSDNEHMLMIGKDIRADLRRLMAYDRSSL